MAIIKELVRCRDERGWIEMMIWKTIPIRRGEKAEEALI